MTQPTTIDEPTTLSPGAQSFHELCLRLKDHWNALPDGLEKQNALSYYTFNKFDQPDKAASLVKYYSDLLSCIDNLDQTTGCDLGCWLGLSSAAMLGAGAHTVFGVDIRAHNTDQAQSWSNALDIPNLKFRPMRPGAIAIKSQSMDWVLINQVLCNAPPNSFTPALAEAHRILKPSGTLIFCDNNNPHCPKTIERLKREFAAAEIADGSPESPNGFNFTLRTNIAKARAPKLSDTQAKDLARNTCYMWGDQLNQAIDDYTRTGTLPSSRFDPDSLKSPMLPADGACNGNLSDPFELTRTLEHLGFTNIDITARPPRRSLDNDALWNEITKAMRTCVFADRAP